jgi:hypothetical protein
MDKAQYKKDVLFVLALSPFIGAFCYLSFIAPVYMQAYFHRQFHVNLSLTNHTTHRLSVAIQYDLQYEAREIPAKIDLLPGKSVIIRDVMVIPRLNDSFRFTIGNSSKRIYHYAKDGMAGRFKSDQTKTIRLDVWEKGHVLRMDLNETGDDVDRELLGNKTPSA